MIKIQDFPVKGTIKEVSSATNPLIKFLKSLHLKKYRQQEKLFLVEGLKLIKDGLMLSWSISHLVVALEKKEDPFYQALIMEALNKGALILFVPKKILTLLTKRDNPQNALAAFQQKHFSLEAFSPKKETVYLALDRVRDPGNLGTIIRTADAFGIDSIILIGDCTDLYALETVRATMGSIFAVRIYFTQEENFLKFKEQKIFQLIGTHLKGALDFRTIDYLNLLKKEGVFLLMGNEQTGLTDALTKASDHLIFIPQIGTADSLNLSIATALTLFEAKRHLL